MPSNHEGGEGDVTEERPLTMNDDNNNDEDDEIRPVLPPRPTQTSPLPVPARPHINDSNNDGNEYPIRRKPIPKSTASASKSYDPLAIELIGRSNNPFDDADDDDDESDQDLGKDYTNTEEEGKRFGHPKAFRKTHLLFGYNLGYWRMPVRHSGIFAVLFLSTFLPCWYAGTKGFATIQDVSGPFTVDCGGGQSGWTFVGLNIRFGRFSFGAAKSIDLAWNWVVGRGVQALLSLLAFRVFQDALLRVVETTPVSYEVYAALALYPTKVEVLWQLCIGIARYGNWRAKFIFVWVFISTVFLVALPSLLDLCSGYDTLYTTNFKWPNGTIQSTEDLANDKWQYSNIMNNSFYWCCQWDEGADYGRVNETCYNTRWDTRVHNLTTYDRCGLNYRDPSYYGSNSSTLYYWNDDTLNISWWNTFAIDPMRASEPSYWSQWDFYPVVRANFPCISSDGTYQFGFSFEWLFVSTIMTSCWLYGMWFLWLDCDVNSEFCRKGRQLGLWRAIADISEAMREELGPNICAYTEQELADALKNIPPVKYYATRGPDNEPGHIGLSSRASAGRLRLRWNYEYGSKIS